MCVIFVCEEKRPSADMVEAGWNANDAGAGAAWREKDRGGATVVRWEKGVTLERAQEMARKLPLPFVLHFRIPSVGGKRESLCHPFPIEPDVPLNLTGKTKGSVLFHNGHWNKWREAILETVRMTPNFKIPMGKWSDTRAMALYAAAYGVGILEFVDEKTVVMSPTQLEVFGGGWSQKDDIWVSNRFFENGGRRGVHHGAGFHYTTPPASLAGNPGTHSSIEPRLPHVQQPGSSQVIIGAKAQGTGGSSSETPFDQATRLFQEKKLSKKQLKKVMKAIKHGKPVSIREPQLTAVVY